MIYSSSELIGTTPAAAAPETPAADPTVQDQQIAALRGRLESVEGFGALTPEVKQRVEYAISLLWSAQGYNKQMAIDVATATEKDATNAQAGETYRVCTSMLSCLIPGLTPFSPRQDRDDMPLPPLSFV